MNRKNACVITLLTAWLLLATPVVESAQVPETQGQMPVIDMHVHALAGGATKDSYGNSACENADVLFRETYKRLREYNIVKAVVSGPLDLVEMWKSKDEDNRVIRGIMWFEPEMDPVRFENLVKTGDIELFGELVPLAAGGTLSDPEWRPYLKICEQHDIPVAIHTGAGPSAATQPWAQKARQGLGNPYLIEDVLLRYPKLRIYMCHSGQAWHEHTLALMESYPNLYTDLGAVLWYSPLVKIYAVNFLKNAKKAGYLNRVMFGSDQILWPRAIEMSIEYLNSLEFLTEKDKRDILYNNAAKFLKLKE